MKFLTVFKEEDGNWSMRRVLALIFALAAVACGAVAIVYKLTWQVVAVSFGVPAAVCIVLLLFTTWGDVASIVSAAKGKKE